VQPCLKINQHLVRNRSELFLLLPKSFTCNRLSCSVAKTIGRGLSEVGCNSADNFKNAFLNNYVIGSGTQLAQNAGMLALKSPMS
jgi:hypothetical protein